MVSKALCEDKSDYVGMTIRDILYDIYAIREKYDRECVPRTYNTIAYNVASFYCCITWELLLSEESKECGTCYTSSIAKKYSRLLLFKCFLIRKHCIH